MVIDCFGLGYQVRYVRNLDQDYACYLSGLVFVQFLFAHEWLLARQYFDVSTKHLVSKRMKFQTKIFQGKYYSFKLYIL